MISDILPASIITILFRRFWDSLQHAPVVAVEPCLSCISIPVAMITTGMMVHCISRFSNRRTPSVIVKAINNEAEVPKICVRGTIMKPLKHQGKSWFLKSLKSCRLVKQLFGRGALVQSQQDCAEVFKNTSYQHDSADENECMRNMMYGNSFPRNKEEYHEPFYTHLRQEEIVPIQIINRRDTVFQDDVIDLCSKDSSSSLNLNHLLIRNFEKHKSRENSRGKACREEKTSDWGECSRCRNDSTSRSITRRTEFKRRSKSPREDRISSSSPKMSVLQRKCKQLSKKTRSGRPYGTHHRH